MTKVVGALIAVLPIISGLPAWAKDATSGPLERYIDKADASFGWKVRREGEMAGGRYVELTLTSQTWHNIVWKHQLFIFKPREVSASGQAILWVGGGLWRDEFDRPGRSNGRVPNEVTLLAAAATQLKSPVAVVMQVPQQPILGGMIEDEAISYTFEKYLRTQDSSWPLLLPMVKSAVRAMDTVQSYAHKTWQLEVKHFTVTGASKRGWTTWLTGAVDPRVNAIAPMVIDVLNMGPQMKHQIASWGRFSEQLADYTNRGIQQHMGTAPGQALRGIVDPYNYRHSLTQPKLILLGTNDRYWPLDALNLYWSGLEGEKYVLYVPNNGHGLKDLERVVGTISALHRRAAGELELPKLSWHLEGGGGKLALELKSDQKPSRVVAWLATSNTRDFRNARWASTHTELVDGAYRYQQKLSGDGFTAMFGEAVYSTAGPSYYLSTNVKIAEGR